MEKAMGKAEKDIPGRRKNKSQDSAGEYCVLQGQDSVGHGQTFDFIVRIRS